VPAAFNPAAGLHARAFYALEALGEEQRLSDDFFNALVNDRRRLDSEAAIAGFVKQFGVDETKFREAFNSFAVDAKVRRAEQLGKRFKIDSVPKLVVDDRQKTGDGLGSYEQMLAVTDFLIDESRKLRQPGTTTP
jgi:thiol:disulfide interchange protein DsbA